MSNVCRIKIPCFAKRSEGRGAMVIKLLGVVFWQGAVDGLGKSACLDCAHSQNANSCLGCRADDIPWLSVLREPFDSAWTEEIRDDLHGLWFRLALSTSMMVLGKPVPVIPCANEALSLNSFKRGNDRFVEAGFSDAPSMLILSQIPWELVVVWDDIRVQENKSIRSSLSKSSERPMDRRTLASVSLDDCVPRRILLVT